MAKRKQMVVGWAALLPTPVAVKKKGVAAGFKKSPLAVVSARHPRGQKTCPPYVAALIAGRPLRAQSPRQ